MFFDKFSLRFSLVASILAMGFLGILLAIFVGEQYRNFAVDSQRAAFQEIIRLQVKDTLQGLERNSKALGQAVQSSGQFRKNFKLRDLEVLEEHLMSQFNQYFVTAGIIRLSRLTLYDENFQYITHTVGEDQEQDHYGQQVCGELDVRVRERTGTDRLKLISELCKINGLPQFGVVVPVGGLRVTGYVEVLTDPAFNFSAIGENIGMPLEMSLPGGIEVYRSKNWPEGEAESNGILSDHMVNTTRGDDVLLVSIIHDVKQFQENLEKTRNTVLVLAFVATLLLALTMFSILKKSALDPIKRLGDRIRKIHKDDAVLGRTITVQGNSEIRELANGFNEMTQELKELYDEIRKANQELKTEIGDRIRAEEELKKHREKLEELVDKRTEDLVQARDEALQANNSKSKFLANMSHELRTPLNAIIGYSEILAEDAIEAGNEVIIRDLAKIRSSGKHLLALINGILDLSKIEAGKMELYPEEFKVEMIISELVATMQPLLMQNKNNFEIKCPENAGLLYTDHTKLRQVMFNLLSNANKFTHNGNISLDVERKELGGGDFIIFSVTDNGIGIAKEKMPDLFQAFSQADVSTTKEYGGTGLGLVISRHFCNMMGGDINVDSEEGRGSCFKIILPADVSKRTTMGLLSIAEDEKGLAMVDPEIIRFTATSEEEKKYIERRSYVSKVLVIDDDPVAVDLMARFLAREGFRTRVALNGKDGIKMAREMKPDVITLDIMMPEMDGWSVLGILKHDPELKDIPVIVLTMVDDRTRGFALGAKEYLTKPFDRVELTELLKGCVQQEEGPQTVLVVDDSLEVRNAARSILEKNGWKVAEAENGLEALVYLKNEEPALILLDLVMPVMDGFELIMNIRKHGAWRKIPVIVMTSKKMSLAEGKDIDECVKYVFNKGAFGLNDLFNEVNNLLGEMLRKKAPDDYVKIKKQ